MNAISDQLLQEFLLSLLLCLVALLCGRYAGFFKGLPKDSHKPSVTILRTLGAFTVFFFSSIIFLPLIITSIFSGAELVKNVELHGYMTILTIGLSSLVLTWYMQKSPARVKHDILAPSNFETSAYKRGMFTWLIAYPCSLFAASCAAVVIAFFDPQYKTVSQAVVDEIMQLRPYPLLFTMTALVVAILMPIIEEILFRGFLQNSLKRWFSKRTSIAVSSFIFACAHFSMLQGIGNIEILVTLFTFALFLGYSYEKWGNILAPIALHQVFNCISLILLIKS